ncbi:hypothetical protein [Streptomyces djakartensis]|jgi:hypothetical protein
MTTDATAATGTVADTHEAPGRPGTTVPVMPLWERPRAGGQR